jgi:murein DD-endopeptidase MepM/ murein hydrolase activator NlpD
MTYANPIGKGLSPERVDMGVDYGGAGPLYALGNGTITNLYNSGWPGGTFLTIHLDSGQYVYYAEDVSPLVQVGQKVSAGQHIANATGGNSGIEIGWAAPPGTGNTMAQVNGQQASHGDPGAVATAFGELMSKLIASLGGPAGKTTGTVSGTVPSSFGIATTGTSATPDATTTSAIGGLFSWPSDITGFFKDAKTFTDALLWIVNPASWLRIGSFGIAIILLIAAILLFAHADEKIGSLPMPMPVPV